MHFMTTIGIILLVATKATDRNPNCLQAKMAYNAYKDGDSAQIGSSGGSAKIGSSGDFAKIGSSGDSAKIDSSGRNSVVMCAGYDSMAKAAIGSWITLAEWKDKEGEWKPVCVKTEYVDGCRIKADTYYKLVDGEFKEVE